MTYEPTGCCNRQLPDKIMTNKFSNKLNLNLRKKLVNCYIWSTALCGSETWHFRRQVCTTWEVLKCDAGEWWRSFGPIGCEMKQGQGERNILHTINRRKGNWIRHILRRNCLLIHVNEGTIQGSLEATGRGWRCKQLLDDLQETKGYCKLKQQALDRTRFGKGYGSVVRQTEECMMYSHSIGRFTFDCSSCQALMTASRCRWPFSTHWVRLSPSALRNRCFRLTSWSCASDLTAAMSQFSCVSVDVEPTAVMGNDDNVTFRPVSFSFSSFSNSLTIFSSFFPSLYSPNTSFSSFRLVFADFLSRCPPLSTSSSPEDVGNDIPAERRVAVLAEGICWTVAAIQRYFLTVVVKADVSSSCNKRSRMSTTSIFFTWKGSRRKAWQENQTASRRRCAAVLFVSALRQCQLLVLAVCSAQADTAINLSFSDFSKSYVSSYNSTTLHWQWRANSRSLVFRMSWEPCVVKNWKLFLQFF